MALPPPPIENILGPKAPAPGARWLSRLHETVAALPELRYVPATSTAADLQAAIDSGLPVLIGPGTLALGTTGVTINGPYNVRGCGEGITTVTYTGTGKAFHINSGGGVETLRGYLGDFTLDGTSSVSGGSIGVELGQTSVSPLTGSGMFERLTIKRFSTAGVKIVVSALATWVRCTFESCKDGLWTTNDYSNGVTGQSLIACRFVTCTKRGAFLEQYDTVSFTNTTQFEDNGEEGALIKHPGGATAVTRNLQIMQSYAEDNGTAGAFSDVRFDNASTQSHQNCKVFANRFQGTNADGNLYFGKGTFTEEDNEFSPVATSNVILLSSTVCFFHGRNTRAPTSYVTAGANAPATFERRGGDGTLRTYTNESGTITEQLQIAANGDITIGGRLSTNCGVLAAYSRGTTQTLTNATYTLIDFATSIHDTHSAVTTGASWKFTCPAGQAGYYRVTTLVSIQGAITVDIRIAVYKNGVSAGDVSIDNLAQAGNSAYGGSRTLLLAAGDYIDIRAEQNSGADRSTIADARFNYVMIERAPG